MNLVKVNSHFFADCKMHGTDKDLLFRYAQTLLRMFQKNSILHCHLILLRGQEIDTECIILKFFR